MNNKEIAKMLRTENDNIDICCEKALFDTPIEKIEKTQSVCVEKVAKKTSFFKSFFAKRYASPLAISLAVVLAFTILLVNIFGREEASALTSYIVEINPSVCVTADADDKVVGICSLNDDGDQIVSSPEFGGIIGKSLEECMQKIVEVSITKGLMQEVIDQNKPIKLYVVNNKQSKAIDKANDLESFFKNYFQSKEAREVEISKKYMPIDDFKDKLQIDSNADDLDKMEQAIVEHKVYKNPESAEDCKPGCVDPCNPRPCSQNPCQPNDCQSGNCETDQCGASDNDCGNGQCETNDSGCENLPCETSNSCEQNDSETFGTIAQNTCGNSTQNGVCGNGNQCGASQTLQNGCGSQNESSIQNGGCGESCENTEIVKPHSCI